MGAILLLFFNPFFYCLFFWGGGMKAILASKEYDITFVLV